MKLQKLCKLLMIVVVVFSASSCLERNVEVICEDYLEIIDQKEFFGVIEICENNMPQQIHQYDGYTSIAIEGDELLLRSFYENLYQDTLNEEFVFILSTVETDICTIEFYDDLGNIRGSILGNRIQVFVEPGINCGAQDLFIGWY